MPWVLKEGGRAGQGSEQDKGPLLLGFSLPAVPALVPANPAGRQRGILQGTRGAPDGHRAGHQRGILQGTRGASCRAPEGHQRGILQGTRGASCRAPEGHAGVGACMERHGRTWRLHQHAGTRRVHAWQHNDTCIDPCGTSCTPHHQPSATPSPPCGTSCISRISAILSNSSSSSSSSSNSSEGDASPAAPAPRGGARPLHQGGVLGASGCTIYG